MENEAIELANEKPRAVTGDRSKNPTNQDIPDPNGNINALELNSDNNSRLQQNVQSVRQRQPQSIIQSAYDPSHQSLYPSGQMQV